MGTHVRLLVADDETAAACRAFLERLRGRAQPLPPGQRAEPAQRRRRRARSRPRRCCAPRSPPGLLAAELTGGLVDPTLTPALEAAGYDRTRRAPELPLAEALRAAPPRRAGGAPNPLEPWRQRHDRRAHDRPPARPQARHRRHRQGPRRGPARAPAPRPLGGRLRRRHPGVGAVRRPRPPPADRRDRARVAGHGRASRPRASTPGCGERRTARRAITSSTRARSQPAWTGLISATALAPTAVEAEALAKAALLSGPTHARGAGCAATAG